MEITSYPGHDVVYVPMLDLEYTVYRYRDDGSLRDRGEMSMEVLAYFESKIEIKNRRVEYVRGDHNVKLVEMNLDMMRASNWLEVRSPFRFMKVPREVDLIPPPQTVMGYFMKFDVKNFGRLGIDVDFRECYHNVFGYSRFETKTHYNAKFRGNELRYLIMRKLSTYNRVFSGDKFGPYTVRSTEGLYPHKMVQLVGKYASEAHTISTSPVFAAAIARGLSTMYDYMGMKKHFGKLKWSYCDEDVEKMKTRDHTASGIRAGKTVKAVKDGLRYVMTPTGSKGVQKGPAIDRVKYYMKTFYETDEIKMLEKACVVCLKDEVFNKFEGDEQSRRRLFDKCREFFIPSLIQYIFATLIQDDRQMFERGRMIKVGMRWWHGGAQYFADQMHYKNPDMVYFDGDYEGLDTTIPKKLLEMYSYSAALYYENVTDKDFAALLNLTSSNLAVKLVHLFGSIWKVIVGTMPSGAKETSHGNSWIVGLLFFAYVEYVKLTKPTERSKIDDALAKGLIEFPVYGDDHVGGVHKSVYHVINEEGYANFVASFCKMKITKKREKIPFFSVPDRMGDVRVDGVVFLKRRFIKRPRNYPHYLPEVLPYKKFSDMLVKFAFGNSQRYNLGDYAIAACGMAYDSMGTNPIAYEFARGLFNECMRAGNYESVDGLITEMLSTRTKEDQKDFGQLLRKAGITEGELRKGFPSERDLLHMHMYDEKYVNFTPPFQRYNASAPSSEIKFEYEA